MAVGSFVALVLGQPSPPILVRVVEQPTDSTSIVGVIIGALGVTAVLLLSAILLGGVLGGILIALKVLRARFGRERVSESEALRVTPTTTR